MLLKSLSFESFSVDDVIYTFSCHNYLGYFPHYEVTKQAINRISVDD